MAGTELVSEEYRQFQRGRGKRAALSLRSMDFVIGMGNPWQVLSRGREKDLISDRGK